MTISGNVIPTICGCLTMRAKVCQETQPGQVVIDFGWGNPWDGGLNVNRLVPDEAREAVCGATPNRCFPCQVRRG
ncbi:MAG: hypothetical protein HYU86_10565 [Chloroflexi bacterium]|nr:hypothetical protein [Chloroflexota bacterium]